MAVVPPPGLSLPQLLAALAHDMKNPLAALTTNLHFLSDAADAASTERDEALEDSLAVSDQLDLLLRNLELFAREAPSSRVAPVALPAVVDEALRRVERMARSAGVAIERGPTPPDARAVGDADLLGRALENCLVNAIEHAPRQSAVVVALSTDGPAPRLRIVASRLRCWSLFEGGDLTGQRPQTIFGRGLSLLCADIAARGGGARLELTRDGDVAAMHLVAPARV